MAKLHSGYYLGTTLYNVWHTGKGWYVHTTSYGFYRVRNNQPPY